MTGVEPSCHGLCDTICLNLKHYSQGTDEDWVDRVNALLPTSVRVIKKYVLSSEMSPKDLHAEVSCTQHRYEYMLPLRLLMPPGTTVPAASCEEGEIEGGSIGTWLQQTVVRRKVYHPTDKNGTSTGIYSMDQQFPFETAEGQARVTFFRNLKRISKVVAGRKAFHNFASGGASPEDNVSCRKIDRIYHKELVLIEGELWVVFSVSGDAFLRGQVRRILGVTVAMARGLLPENYFDLAVEKGTICEVPALPGWGLYLAECKYAYYEAKFEEMRLDPRRVSGADCSRVDAWKTEIHTHIANLSKTVGDDWLAEFDASCKDILQRQQTMHALMTRPRPVLEAMYQSAFGRAVPVNTIPKTESSNSVADQDGPIADVVCAVDKSAADAEIQYQNALKCHSDPVVCAAYARVLRLLQEADASGLWPANSTGRQKVIVNAPEAVAAEDSQTDLTALPDGNDAAADNDDVDADDVGAADKVGHAQDEADPNSEPSEDTDEVKDEEESDKASTIKVPRKHRNSKAHKLAHKAKKQRANRPETTAGPVTAAVAKPVPTEAEETGDDNEHDTASPSPMRTGVQRPPMQPAHRRRDEKLPELVSDAGVGGSFSVGCLPKHLAQPKGNQLFPGEHCVDYGWNKCVLVTFNFMCGITFFHGITDLMKACFDLEKVLCPHRPPSSTIAINRHAQFSPHRDSGAGSGQSQSLIVALGDFIGGEIAVESAANDIRYKPLEFDGWMQRHWTLPFVGQRFSLVWFTPLGITEDDLFWWKE